MDKEIKERYKLQEVAEIVAQGGIAEISQILHKLEQSVRNGCLQVFQSGSNVRYEFGSNNDSSEIKESDLIRPDADVSHSGFTWVDKEYDEQLHEVLHPPPDNLEVYWDDLNTWVTENEPRLNYKFKNPGISVAGQTKSQTRNSKDTETPPTTNWIMRVQAEAASIWCKQKRTGCSPTKRSIKRDLAKWCKENDVTTDYGLFPSEDYIYRHVTRKWDPPKC